MIKLQSIVRNAIAARERRSLSDHQFIIISNNCWGYEIYNILGRPYNTPFVGLFMYPECYLHLLANFPSTIYSKLEFTNQSKYNNFFPKYPIGILNNEIEIHFLHYTTRQDAESKWNRRVGRLAKSLSEGVDLHVKFCDRDKCSVQQLNRFHSLPFANKVSFTAQEYHNPNNVNVPFLKDANAQSVIDGLILFRNRYRCFDFAQWILTGKVLHSLASRIIGRLYS